MKKYLIRAAVFLLLFALCFSGAQSILHYRWSGNENLYTRNIRYSQAAPDSIDVLCLGTSELYAAYDPTRKQALPATILPSPSAAP